MKNLVVWLMIALVGSVVGSLASTSGAQVTGGHPVDALGSYGTDGPIERSMLPEGVRIVVSDEAIALAVSPALSDARRSWASEQNSPSTLDFVDQVDYQLTYRTSFDYLSSDPAHLGELLVAKPLNAGISGLGLYLTDEEAAEMERRVADSDPIFERVREFYVERGQREGDPDSYDPNFAGVWQDQLNGGVVVLAVVDRSMVPQNLVALEEDGTGLRIIEVSRSFEEFVKIRDEISQVRNSLGLAADVQIDTTPIGRRIRLTVADPSGVDELSDALEAVTSSLTDTEFLIEVGPTLSSTGNPLDQHSKPNQQPGLAIRVQNVDFTGFCTWGLNGNTSSWHYLVSAGHCWGPTQGTSSGYTTQNVRQNRDAFPASVNVTPNSNSNGNYLRSIDDGTHDSSRISSKYANDNCYHWGHCSKNTDSRASHNTWDLGQDRTCASLGSSNVFRCGLILEMNWDGTRWFRFEFATISGDSGSGLIEDWPYAAVTIDGIVIQGGIPVWSVGTTAYDVKKQLGFDFNCWPGPITYSDPNSWPKCPVVDS